MLRGYPSPKISANSLPFEQHAKNVYESHHSIPPIATGWTAAADWDTTLLTKGHNKAAFYRRDLSSSAKSSPRYVLAFAGTKLTHLPHWFSNLSQAYSGVPLQYLAAAIIADAGRHKYGLDLTIVGHSLGGGLATYAGLMTVSPEMIESAKATLVWQYNAPALAAGCKGKLREHLGSAYRALASKAVISINVRGEILSGMFVPGRNLQIGTISIGFKKVKIPIPSVIGQLGSVYFVPAVLGFWSRANPFSRIHLHSMKSLIDAMDVHRKRFPLPP